MPLDVQPKYSKGQIVYKGGAYYMEHREQCPDCLGTREWTATTPKGEQFPVCCNTCHEGWESKGTIRVYKDSPVVETLTIGSIRFDTSDDEVFSYMCHETGVGCGTVHYESTLFESREEAQQYANCKAAENAAKRNEQEAESRKRKKREKTRKTPAKLT